MIVLQNHLLTLDVSHLAAVPSDGTSKCQIILVYPLDTHAKLENTVKLGNKELFDKELIGIKEPFPVPNLSFTS